ncbi:MAG: hypothetical protein M3Y36_05645 [Actinomycetota bacterium]|nr:hypothetical protein [Actinomycetota bacterium]
MRSTWIGAWLSGAVLALSLLSFVGATAASAAPARGVVAQTTCPTDPYTRAATPCDNGATSGNAGAGTTASSTSPSSSGGGGSLASTGADILKGLLAAALLILLGTTLILAARQRRQTA